MTTRTSKGKAGIAVAVFVVLMGTGPVQADSVEGGPLPPWGLTSTATGSGIELTWNAPLGSVDSYNIYRADDAEAVVVDGLEAFSLIGGATDLVFLDAGESETRGVYYVTAVGDGRESMASNLAGYPHCWSLDSDCFLPIPLVGP